MINKTSPFMLFAMVVIVFCLSFTAHTQENEKITSAGAESGAKADTATEAKSPAPKKSKVKAKAQPKVKSKAQEKSKAMVMGQAKLSTAAEKKEPVKSETPSPKDENPAKKEQKSANKATNTKTKTDKSAILRTEPKTPEKKGPPKSLEGKTAVQGQETTSSSSQELSSVDLVPSGEDEQARSEETSNTEETVSATEEEQQNSDEPKILTGSWTKSIIFSTDDGSFQFQPQSWIQPRLQLAINPDAEDPVEGSGFSFKRARVGFQAWLLDWAHIYLDTGFATGTGRLIDFYLDIDPFDGLAILRVGYFRPWYCRQLLQATTKLQMIEYAQAWQDGNLGLALDRDLGASVHGMFLGGVEYGIGIWNGEHTFSTAGNIDSSFGGRIAAHPLALAGLGGTVPIGDESDMEGAPRPGLVIGFAAFYEKRHDKFVEMGGLPQEYYDHQFRMAFDLGFRYLGFSVTSEFFFVKTSLQDDTPQVVKDAVADADNTVPENLEGVGLGYYFQAGYFVIPSKLELAARFDAVDEDYALRGVRYYPAIGASYYLLGHNLKAQFMYRLRAGNGYEDTDPAYIPTSHDFFLMFQAYI